MFINLGLTMNTLVIRAKQSDHLSSQHTLSQKALGAGFVFKSKYPLTDRGGLDVWLQSSLR